MSSPRKITAGAKIVPHLWFVDNAVEAAEFYVSLFPDSRVHSVTPVPADTPSGPAGAESRRRLGLVVTAAEVAEFYVSLFPASRVQSVPPVPADPPSGPAGSVAVVGFTLAGQPLMAISAGPFQPFSHAISFIVN